MSVFNRIAVFVFLSVPVAGFSQMEKVNFAEEAIGKADGNVTWITKRVNATQKIGKATAASLTKSLLEQASSYYSMPELNPPHGFSTKTSLTINFDSRSIPNTSLLIDNYYLENDRTSGAVKTSHDGVLFALETNNIEHFTHQQGSYSHDCAELNIPDFFEEIPVTDSTEDYIEINYRYYGHPHSVPNQPIRIIKANNRPVFIPFTRRNYMEYLVVKNEFNIKSLKATIADIQKNIKETKETIANGADNSIKDVLASTIMTMNNQVAQAREKIGQLETEHSHLKSVMSAMPAAEANAPARVIEKGDFGSLESLLPVGRSEGDALYKINPAYFDVKPGAKGAQLIIVYYTWTHLSAFESDPDYLQQKIMKLFDEIDYHRLKESMR
jgi:hypothetical protein